MQPCPVCGRTGVDANGYCTTCSTYLGVPQQPVYPTQPEYGASYPGQPVTAPAPTTPYPSYPAQPSSSVPYSSAPASAPGYGQASAPPGYAQASAPPGYGQVSAPPTYGTPGYGYPLAPPVPPKKSYTGAIVAAGAGLVVLIAAIVVVLVVKNNGGKPVANPTNRPTAVGSGSASPTGLVDPCVVGDWKVVEEQITADFDTYTNVPVSLDNNYKVSLKADGTGKEDYAAYADETDYLATYSGHDFQLAFDGTLTYNFKTTGGKMSTSASITSGRIAKWIDHKNTVLSTNQFGDFNWTYTCSGDTMTRTLSDDNQRLTRL